jgi:hypothetical protein
MDTSRILAASREENLSPALGVAAPVVVIVAALAAAALWYVAPERSLSGATEGLSGVTLPAGAIGLRRPDATRPALERRSLATASTPAAATRHRARPPARRGTAPPPTPPAVRPAPAPPAVAPPPPQAAPAPPPAPPVSVTGLELPLPEQPPLPVQPPQVALPPLPPLPTVP